jgi:signal transduction histidine kinase
MLESLLARSFLAPTHPESIRREESALILLNLAVLAGIGVAHVLFGPTLGTPSRVFYLLLLGRFLMQTIELFWLQGPRDQVGSLVSAYANASIWMNLLFAFLLSRLSGVEDSHYVVLMLIPIVAASFRYTFAGVATVVCAAAAITFGELWLFFRTHPQRPTEYFEAASVVLTYAVIGFVVSLLTRQIRSEQETLRQNVLELQRTRDRLVEEEKLAAIGRLSSAIAHEIRNPVAMIVSSLSMVRRGETDSLSRDDLFEIMQQESSRLERLTTDFLTFTRRKPPELSDTPVATALGYVADLTRARSIESGIAMSIRCDDDLVASIDPFRVHQALLNLVVNAIEATPRGGSILLGGERRGLDVALFVENSGDAIPADIQGRLFEPFFTTRDRGSGLGLAIALRVAHDHGGEARLERNEPGRVRFTLQFPGALRHPSREEQALGPPSSR